MKTNYETIKIQDDNELDKCCIICFEDLMDDKVALLECGHYFHYNCVESWLKKENCPICRKGENIIQIITNSSQDNDLSNKSNSNNYKYNKYKECFKKCSIS